MTNNPVADLVTNKITMTYRNYRGEVSERTITPLSIRWGVTEWHPVPGWLLTAFDHGKQADRDFALADCQFAALTPASAEPVAWRIRPYAGCSWMLLHYIPIPSLPHGWECEPLYAQPAPMTVEAEAKVLLERHAALISDGQYGQANTFRKTEIIEFLRALSGEKS